ncbi:hypothetical protein BU14_0548s0008 [Porphyra umbilicalis]|uniref:Uncharacterized protein n=1 Tax=Porphyra umbilicalis TaxID=2786 RepID=A0A1X6NRZ2_PORUM|nr:hypothetical protein BU14_0548s0008 [Porphyra umbilicalis]|eukprot:OSX71358.1 hypothetical protein BU14_0548s0008 [Porphyra umbilicalis]
MTPRHTPTKRVKSADRLNNTRHPAWGVDENDKQLATPRVPLGDARGKEVDKSRRKAIRLVEDGAEGARHHRLHRQIPPAEVSHPSGRMVEGRPQERCWLKRQQDAQEEVHLASVAVFCDRRGSRGCMCLGGDRGSLGSATESSRAPRCLAGRIDIRERRSDLRVPGRRLRVPNRRDGGPQAGMTRLLQRSVRRRRLPPLARPHRRLPPLARSRRHRPPSLGPADGCPPSLGLADGCRPSLGPADGFPPSLGPATALVERKRRRRFGHASTSSPLASGSRSVSVLQRFRMAARRGALTSGACKERPEERQRKQTTVVKVGLLGHIRRGDGEARQRPSLPKSSIVSSNNATPHALVLQPLNNRARRTSGDRYRAQRVEESESSRRRPRLVPNTTKHQAVGRVLRGELLFPDVPGDGVHDAVAQVRPVLEAHAVRPVDGDRATSASGVREDDVMGLRTDATRRPWPGIVVIATVWGRRRWLQVTTAASSHGELHVARGPTNSAKTLRGWCCCSRQRSEWKSRWEHGEDATRLTSCISKHSVNAASNLVCNLSIVYVLVIAYSDNILVQQFNSTS